jgi:hypothetical protein
MTGMVRKALTIAAGLAVVASVASAGVPDSRNSTADGVIVGGNTGATLPIGVPGNGYDVVVKDVNNTGLVGRTVSLDFSATAVKVYTQANQNAGTTVNAVTCVASRVTGAGGAVKFSLRFGGSSNTNSVAVSCDGVPLATVKARSTDINALDATTNVGDFSDFASDLLFAPNTSPRTDFNEDGTTGVADFADFVAELLTGVTGAYCP